ncbi:hypothetical protein [Coleofasciculus chthonoplastes]|uniref:hypothetical protein n=1 Tax=Coleofasciculus chthonoplastes TaxID=64178 RepID=UPI001E493FBD|nr:hypothetical protein [Coleofasciculus chthonoplastes]
MKNSTLWIYPPDLGDNLTKLPRYGEMDASESRSQHNCPPLILNPAVYCPPGFHQKSISPFLAQGISI